MYSSVFSASIFGMEARKVRVEADVSNGLPGSVMVGYLSGVVKEAMERVRTALKNSGFQVEPKKVTVKCQYRQNRYYNDLSLLLHLSFEALFQRRITAAPKHSFPCNSPDHHDVFRALRGIFLSAPRIGLLWGEKAILPIFLKKNTFFQKKSLFFDLLCKISC